MPSGRRLLLAPLAALSACAGGQPRLGGSASVECVLYARQVSGVQLFGDAASWWDAAAGRYARSSEPSPGAVLVFRRTARLPSGHVAVVAALRSPREIDVTQANWAPGRIARSEPVVDVSPGNDWTAVRVWWAPLGQTGSSTYPTFGFIAPGPPGAEPLAQAVPGDAVVASR